MLKRTISGIGLIIVIFGSILLSEYSALLLILVLFTLGFNEFRKMFRFKDTILFITHLIAGLLAIVYYYLYFERLLSQEWIILFAIVLLTITIIHHLIFSISTFLEISQMLFTAAWMAGTLIFFFGLGYQGEGGPYNPEYMVVLLCLIWINDIAAYFFGSLIGKHPLAASISPGKTWEGFIAGIIVNAGAGVAVYYITHDLSVLFWILASVFISLTATAGDLFESKLKREAGVKDSGNLIPGHGGVLDRFDSLMFSAPVFFGVLVLFNKI